MSDCRASSSHLVGGIALQVYNFVLFFSVEKKKPELFNVTLYVLGQSEKKKILRQAVEFMI